MITLSSKTDEWLTDPKLLGRIRAIRPIGLDPFHCPGSMVDAQLAIDCREGFDGFAEPWAEIVRAHCWPDSIAYVNPPYSKLAAALSKCASEHYEGGVPVVANVPCRIETAAFQDHVLNGRYAPALHGPAVFAFRGRLRFWRDIEIEWSEVSRRPARPERDRRLAQIEQAALDGATVIASDSATFPSCLVVWGDQELISDFRDAFGDEEGRWIQ